MSWEGEDEDGSGQPFHHICPGSGAQWLGYPLCVLQWTSKTTSTRAFCTISPLSPPSPLLHLPHENSLLLVFFSFLFCFVDIVDFFFPQMEHCLFKEQSVHLASRPLSWPWLGALPAVAPSPAPPAAATATGTDITTHVTHCCNTVVKTHQIPSFLPGFYL